MGAKHFRCQVTPSAYRRRFWSPERGRKILEDPWSIRSDTFALFFAHLVPLRSPWPDLLTWKVYPDPQTRISSDCPTLHVGNESEKSEMQRWLYGWFLIVLVVVSNNQHNEKSQELVHTHPARPVRPGKAPRHWNFCFHIEPKWCAA